MVAPNLAPSESDVNDVPETLKDKNPSRINELGFPKQQNGTPWDVPEPHHMWSIMTWPKPEQETWVAPSIRRAKS